MPEPANDPKNNNDPAPTNNNDDNSSGAPQNEEAFWKKLEGTIDGRLNDFFEKKKSELFPAKTSRNGGRKTLPDIIADVMFGTQDKK